MARPEVSCKPACRKLGGLPLPARGEGWGEGYRESKTPHPALSQWERESGRGSLGRVGRNGTRYYIGSGSQRGADMPGAGTDKTKIGAGIAGPIVILVEPQLAENVGTTARAMANFGLERLRVVNPREDFLGARARAAASGADRILEHAERFDTLQAAIGDCTLVLAATAREHDQAKAVVSAEQAAGVMGPRVAAGENV